MIVAVQPTIASKIWSRREDRGLRCANALRAGSARCSRPRRSSRRPAGRARRRSPAIEIWLSEKPMKYSAARPIASDSGIEIITTLAARKPERQQRDGDQRDRDAEVGRQPVEPVRDVLRLVEAELQVDALGQLRFEAVGGGDDALAHFEDVVAVLLVRGHEHRALARCSGRCRCAPAYPSSPRRCRGRVRCGRRRPRRRCRGLRRAFRSCRKS